ncbi:MAG: DUF1015 domain-containing protein [Thermodesulfobacteriota bacterium]|jgi:uncharacterized protein (DUF1015 family)|nr:MAG: DUF1015 domain-containing protein [Thermodesulfobacteriota bacterium]
MAIIKPFRGYLYNKEKIADLELVVAPPYDVINAEQQDYYYKKHPLNIIRLDLGKQEPDDNEMNNRYTRAADFLATWQKDATLVRTPKPAIFFYVQDFKLPSGESRRRKGFVCLFKLEEFSSGVILPHERTLSKPKADRLNLTRACRANFNPVFSLYSDPSFTIERHCDAAGEKSPYLDVMDENGVRHKLWVVDDPEVIKEIEQVLHDKKVLIADGHHRYETALNYQKIMREKYPGSTGAEPFNYTLMYFTNMDDAGLVILPTHRLLKNLNFNATEFLNKAQEFFDIQVFPFASETEEREREKVLAAMKKEAKERFMLGMVTKKQGGYFLLRLKDFSLMDKVIRQDLSKALRYLDVTIMEFLVFNTLMGITCNDPRWEDNFTFVHTEREAVELVKTGVCEVAFLLNPTRIEQVSDVVAQREVMPQKSTYFIPKLLSGLVVNPINPEEKIA